MNDLYEQCPDALPGSAIINPMNFASATLSVAQSNLDAAIGTYCDTDDEDFFKGYKRVSYK
ncbi:MAG: hypothetical protein LQ349_004078 [Xanthoria aureola]|nr:MAG: hypothetical protein LQ349_004078 [Xanthoria aureola]